MSIGSEILLAAQKHIDQCTVTIGGAIISIIKRNQVPSIVSGLVWRSFKKKKKALELGNQRTNIQFEAVFLLPYSDLNFD